MSGNMSITTRRLKDLIDGAILSRKEIAESEEMHCDVSTITKHYNGDREVNADFIARYARYFGVSADYLLGLTDQKTDNKDLKYACNYAGLSEESINKLHEYYSDCRYEEDITPIDVLNYFIETGALCDLIKIMCDYNNHIFNDSDSINYFTKQLKKEYKDYKAGKLSAEDLSVYNPMDIANESYVDLFKMQELPKDVVKAYFYNEHSEYRAALEKLFDENTKHQQAKYSARRKEGVKHGNYQETE